MPPPPKDQDSEDRSAPAITIVPRLAPLSEAEPLLLASASPRRREILTQLGIPILVSAVDVDESVLAGEAPEAYLERVTTAKLTAASRIFAVTAFPRGDTLQGANIATASGAVLVADTSVIDGGAILGKPTSDDDAREMIARLSGKTHEVWTRFAVGAPECPARILHEETVRTRVTFRPLMPSQVRAYVASGEGRDKAGAYAVQGRGAGIVSRIEGSYTNVVGLPACEVVLALERLGLCP
jgi:septum formation protein